MSRALPAPTMTGISAADVLSFQEAVESVTVEDAILDYMLSIVEKTRTHDSLALGVSPRGAQALYRATQALALIEGRDFALPDDVKRLAVPVFCAPRGHQHTDHFGAAANRRRRAHHRRNPQSGWKFPCKPFSL